MHLTHELTDNLYLTNSLEVALISNVKGHFDISEHILKQLNPQDPRVLYALAWHKMRHGQFKKAMEQFTYGRYIRVFGLPPIVGKIWKDEPLEEKIVLFRCEAGYGDQFCNFRFAKCFEKMGARVIISCAPKLKKMFSRHGFFCVDNEVAESVYYDYWIPSMSSPFLLGLDHDELNGSAFIFAEAPKKLISKENSLKVGVRWSGSEKFDTDDENCRRFPKELMINLSDIPNTTFYSLQKDENLVDNLPFKDMGHQIKTWEDTANIIASCDLIISSCTSTAHLAAAMGKPTWIIVPIMPYYTWAMPGNKTPWYDSVKLYRQEKFKDWNIPFQKVREDLNDLAKKSHLL